jgi:hypothetical protein
LASFHYAFHLFCKDEFPAEGLFEDCCDEFDKHVQQEVVFSSVCQDENYVVKEDLHDTNKNCIAVNASDLISITPAAFDLHEETVREGVFSKLFQEVAYDMFSPVIGEKDLKTVCLSLHDLGVFCSPIVDKYADAIEQTLTSKDVDSSNNQPIYDIYESDFDEPFSLPIKERHHVVISHSMFAEDISNHDQEFVDPHFDNHDDAFDIVLNVSIKDGCHQDQEVLNDCNNIETSDIISDVSTALDIHENQHISFEGFEVKEKIYTLAGRIDRLQVTVSDLQ